MAPVTTQLSSQHMERQPLRRATYVHVSDLISAYNIDHVQLEREISRVNENRNKSLHTSGTDFSTTGDVVDTEQPHGGLASDKIDDGTTGDSNNEASGNSLPAPDEVTDAEQPIIPPKRLQPPRGGFNLCVLVGNINLVVDKKRVDQSRVRLAEVEIGDETGTVSLRARDEQIDLLERVRSGGKPRAVVLRNCSLELYQGKHIRLAVTKWGKLTEYPDNVASTPGPPPTLNLSRNFSFIDLSLVASEIVEKEQPDSLPFASATASTTTASRQTKKTDLKASRSSPSSTTQSKQGQYGTKHQQNQSRRNSRMSTNEQRRQSRSTQYGGMKADTTQPHSGKMMYHSMQGYHVYGDQSVDMRLRQQYLPQAPYVHSHVHSQSPRQQDTASAQYALHQQYEMQQRQFHQLYTREQNRQVGHVQQQHLPSQTLIRHMGSFDAPMGSYTGDIPLHSEVANSPNIIPSPDHCPQLQKAENNAELQHEDSQTAVEYASIESYRLAKMNPEASSFAPSYLNAAQGTNTQQHLAVMPGSPQYHSYNLSQQQQPQQHSLPGASMYSTLQSSQHPTFYMPAAISSGAYHHTMPYSFEASLDRDADRNLESKSSASTTSRSFLQHQNPPTAASAKESKSSTGKENITSKP